MSDQTTPNMCPRASVYFVSGLGGSNPPNFTVPFQSILDTVFGILFKPAQRKEILPNRSKFGLSRESNLVKRVKEIACKHEYCNKVSLVWFAHSHGAKVVCDAYDELKCGKDFKKIKEGSAIVCIGGASVVTPQLAKIAFNVEFKNDKTAAGGSKIVGNRSGTIMKIGPFENDSCSRCDESAPKKPELHHIYTDQRGLGSIINSVGGASTLSSVRFGTQGHFLGQYMACRKWRMELRKSFHLAEGCSVHRDQKNL